MEFKAINSWGWRTKIGIRPLYSPASCGLNNLVVKYYDNVVKIFTRVRNDHEVDQNLTTDLVGCLVAERVPDQLGDFIQLKRP